ncbi:hypothetical protein Tco_0550097, partial [Tanacetum coccineum]
MKNTSYSTDVNTPYRSVKYHYVALSSQNTPYCLENRYAILLGKQIRRLDCETQYAVLIRRFERSYPTGGYGVS